MVKKRGLASRLKNLLRNRSSDPVFFEDMEEALIQGDLGPMTAAEIIADLKAGVARNNLKSSEEIFSELKSILHNSIMVNTLLPESGRLNIYLVMGVNGVGKTTTIAKLAAYFQRNTGSEKILLSAGDTFRAAAIEQLSHWGRELGLQVIKQSSGADPGAVIFDTISSAKAQGAEVILADTAGRLHNKSHLVRELAKIDKIICAKVEAGVYHRVLIIDATTGQNALRQAEIFREAIGVDSAILTKYDSTAKGGIVIPVCRTYQIPFSFLCTGEGLKDIAPFNKESYLDSLIEV
ncbi:MAG: signal recognition particle-docking protein FtsY [Spirochaeta sp.]|nr:signal recognition particle-docking protein FtsY [Spirochaeta sp.]